MRLTRLHRLPSMYLCLPSCRLTLLTRHPCESQVFQVAENGRSARLLTSSVNLSGEAAAGLHGGALLGVKLNRVQRVGRCPALHLCTSCVPAEPLGKLRTSLLPCFSGGNPWVEMAAELMMLRSCMHACPAGWVVLHACLACFSREGKTAQRLQQVRDIRQLRVPSFTSCFPPSCPVVWAMPPARLCWDGDKPPHGAA